MRKRLKRLELVPALFALTALALCLALGIWQVERLRWKNEIIGAMSDALARPVLGTLAEARESEAALYRRASITGAFIGERAFRFIGRQSNGYVWAAPFQETDSDNVILVVLGWRPGGGNESLPSGLDARAVEGMLRPPRAQRFFSPQNQPERNLWFTEDISALGKAAGKELYPLVLDAAPPALPRNDHLGYAITWFALAVVALAMGIAYHWKRA